MKQLWAPWRLAFVEKETHGPGCIFCDQPALHQDRRAYILWRGRHAYVMMNIYPYNNGHLLIAPYRHIGTLEDLPQPVVLDMLRLTQRAIRAIRRAYAPEGFNLGVNQGRVAGAGIEHHVHLHIVPRWGADTNFMTLLGETRVLPQDLKASYARLKASFKSNAARRSSDPDDGHRRRTRASRAGRRAS
ncbi:MAG TPA: HIT domain-containing protein [Nitrospirales bacterium]|nr:HIT domain-containing protein [Nitrospirales bacterium]